MATHPRTQELERENARWRERLRQQEDANAQLREQVEHLQRELEEWKRGHRVRPRRARRGGQATAGKQPGRKRGHAGRGRPCPGEAEVGREVHVDEDVKVSRDED